MSALTWNFSTFDFSITIQFSNTKEKYLSDFTHSATLAQSLKSTRFVKSEASSAEPISLRVIELRVISSTESAVILNLATITSSSPILTSAAVQSSSIVRAQEV
jgi:hypothetical protein